VKHQLPYYPLWSKSLVEKFVDPNSGLLTNNGVEGWFHIVKNHILEEMKRFRER